MKTQQQLTKNIEGLDVTASYYTNEINEYIKFVSQEGNALWCLNLQGWAVIRQELPMEKKEQIFKAFEPEFNQVIPTGTLMVSEAVQTLERYRQVLTEKINRINWMEDGDILFAQELVEYQREIEELDTLMQRYDTIAVFTAKFSRQQPTGMLERENARQAIVTVQQNVIERAQALA